jgi:hypothetical protein
MAGRDARTRMTMLPISHDRAGAVLSIREQPAANSQPATCKLAIGFVWLFANADQQLSHARRRLRFAWSGLSRRARGDRG